MNTPEPTEPIRWQRVSPVAVVFFALRGLRRLVSEAASLTPLLVIVVINESLRGLVLNYGLFVALGVLLGGAVVWYLTFLHTVSDERIVLRQGILRRRTLTLDFHRVQQADVQVPWYYRPFGLAVLTLDSAGASGQTVYLSGIPATRAETLREQILAARTATEDDPAAAEEPDTEADFSLYLPRSEVLRYGLMHNTLLVILPVLAPFSEVLVRRLETVVEIIAPDWLTVESLSVGQRLLAASGLLFVVLLVLVSVSVLLGLLRYHGYQLERRGEQFRYRAGLTTVLTRSVRQQRIQMVTVRLSWIGRLLGRHSLVISKAGDLQAGQDTERFVVPVLTGRALTQLEQQLQLPQAAVWQRAHVQALVFGAGRWLALGAVLIGWLTLQGVPGAFLGVLAGLTALVTAASILGWWRLRLCRDRAWLGLSQGVIGRTTRWLPTARVQSVAVVQPFWQRRLGLANLEVRAAGGRLTLPWIPREQAERWRDELLCEVAGGDIL